MAEMDQDHATIRDRLANGVQAYMSMVACFFLTIVATSLHPDDFPPEAGERFRDMILVSTWSTLPAQYRALG